MDEMYWIGTGRIVPLLGRGDLKNQYWNEFAGYTNLNGAKWIYGFGLAVMGHTNYSFAGNPPDHICDACRRYVGALFPTTNALYSWLRDGRMISATFAAFSLVLMAVLAYDATGFVLLAFMASVLLFASPIVQSVSIIAYADTFFLFFQLVCMYMAERYMRAGSPGEKIRYTILLGFFVAYLTSVKLNGFWFVGIAFFYILLRSRIHTPKSFLQNAISDMVLFASGFFVSFDLIHPNFFFYPERSIVTIIRDRVAITQYQMVYFSSREPGHVLWTLPSRFNSSWMHLFNHSSVLGIGFVVALLVSSILFWRRPSYGKLFRIFVCLLITYSTVLAYVGFDEPRYFLPVLPYLILFVVCLVKKVVALLDKKGDVAHYRL